MKCEVQLYAEIKRRHIELSRLTKSCKCTEFETIIFKFVLSILDYLCKGNEQNPVNLIISPPIYLQN